ncbi:MAG: HAMP domain-containing protein, partial [Lentisphaeraceae bacterium]|nr:HAMP domain-containing protein [Lentisphaeraceae bacterium]
MTRINYTWARLLSISAYALLVFIFCAVMIAQLDKNIQWSEIFVTEAEEDNKQLEKVYYLHREVISTFPLKGSVKERKSQLIGANGKIKECLAALNQVHDPKKTAVKQAYQAIGILIRGLSAEYHEDILSEEIPELLEAIDLSLRRSMDFILEILSRRSGELIKANRKSTSLFVNLRSYMVNFCVVIALILIVSTIYVNRLLRRPVKELAKAADEIRSGNLEYTLDVRDTPRDELGMLMRNFNIMARRLSHTASRLEFANKSLKQEADVLTELSKQKTQFIRHLGHELRAPLSSIIGFSELMLEGLYGDLTEKQEDYLGRVMRSGNHLLELVNDLVDQAKMQAGTLKLNYERYKLKVFVSDTVSSFESQADKEGLELFFSAPTVDDALLASFDGKRVRQVLINLINNAIKFTPEGESVS